MRVEHRKALTGSKGLRDQVEQQRWPQAGRSKGRSVRRVTNSFFILAETVLLHAPGNRSNVIMPRPRPSRRLVEERALKLFWGGIDTR